MVVCLTIRLTMIRRPVIEFYVAGEKYARRWVPQSAKYSAQVKISPIMFVTVKVKGSNTEFVPSARE